MKLTKKTIKIGAVATFAVVLIAATIFIGLQKNPVITDGTEKQNSSTDMVIQLPSENPTESNIKAEPDNTSNPDLTVNVDGNPQNPNNSNKTPAKDTDKPVNPVTPTQPNNNSGINIGGSQQPTYNCNTENHHCDGPETHAYITNLELKGCPLCGSHSCPSFYALDEWGHTCYNVTKCPKYDVTKDPVFYCQICGKRNGDGTNGTCVQFVNDAYCPNCNQFVKANTCHTCP